MPPPPQFMFPMFAELVFTIISVMACVAIYVRTGESFALTKHKGIGYFRDAFLFFGLSYLLRLLVSLLFLFRFSHVLPIQPRLIMPFFLFLTGYFSTIGIMYLLLSSAWKRLPLRYVVPASHILAMVLSLVAFLSRSHIILLLMQSALLLAVVIVVFTTKQGKKLSQTRVLYFLVSLLWLIHLWAIGHPPHYPIELEMTLYVISLAVFFLIYRKLRKWV